MSPPSAPSVAATGRPDPDRAADGAEAAGAAGGERAAPPPAGVGSARRSRRRRLAILIVLLLLAADLARPPRAQASARLMLGAIHLYQGTLSPRMPLLGVRCRFQPTCSHYAEAAIRQDGALVGAARAAWRVLRCGPWTPPGTVDPP